jgi:MOSC domain-containing protein YiiM
MPDGTVVAVCSSPAHHFSKSPQDGIELVKGVGVVGDAHAGGTVKHRSRVRRDPTQPNLRQVHLLHQELLDSLRGQGFKVSPGTIGENVTTRDIDLLALPRGAVLSLGESATIEITGLRNPCAQLDGYQKGLTAAVLDRDEQGNLVRLAGIMAIVTRGGTIRLGDPIFVRMPDGASMPLEPV